MANRQNLEKGADKGFGNSGLALDTPSSEAERGERETDLDQFLMQNRHLLRWVNECLACHHKGYKPEMPEPDADISIVISAKLRRLADELVLDEDCLCEQCRQAKITR